MKLLSIDNFLYISDFELSQYQILAGLEKYKTEFQSSRIFPALKELAQLSSALKQIKRKNSKLLQNFSIPVKKVDVEARRLEFDTFTLYEEDVNRILDLIKWAIPVIDSVIDQALSVRKVSTPETIEESVSL